MQQYEIGEVVDIDWMGWNGPETLQGVVINFYADDEDSIEVRLRRGGHLIECTFEPYRVHKVKHYSIMGDTYENI